MLDIYSPLRIADVPFVITNVETAEMIKYASNSFLATKISFINECAELCEALGADVEVVARGMGLDNRIGGQFLHPGPGFGGSCFPQRHQRTGAHRAQRTTCDFRSSESGARGQRSGQGAYGGQGLRTPSRDSKAVASHSSDCRSSPRPTTFATARPFR